MFMLDGKLLPIDTSFQHNGTSFPANWLRLTSLEEKQAIGITEVADPETWDDRFWWGVDNPKQLNDETITPEGGTPYVQKGLKSLWTATVRETANKLLSTTDWMIIRKAERNVDVPAETTTYRQSVIAECGRLVTAIEACADVPSLIAVIGTQNWNNSQGV